MPLLLLVCDDESLKRNNVLVIFQVYANHPSTQPEGVVSGSRVNESNAGSGLHEVENWRIVKHRDEETEMSNCISPGVSSAVHLHHHHLQTRTDWGPTLVLIGPVVLGNMVIERYLIGGKRTISTRSSPVVDQIKGRTDLSIESCSRGQFGQTIERHKK